MTASITALPVARAGDTPRTLEEWRARLTYSNAGETQGVLDNCREHYKFQQSCPKKKGGTIYSRYMAEWFGYSEETASHRARIGSEFEKLCNFVTQLPCSWGALYEISSLPPDVIAEKITPKTTADDVRAIKRELAAESLLRERGGRVAVAAAVAAEAEQHKADRAASNLGLATALGDALDECLNALDTRDAAKITLAKGRFDALWQTACDEALAGGTAGRDT